jgi:hypothetical protein
MRPTYALILALSFCSAALAQTTGDGARGSTPPGMSQDGARPADGALKGGSILPGEQGGLPGKKDPAGPTSSSERLQRCDELTGVLRDDCLRKERSAAGGSSAPPERDRDNDERDLK